MKDRVPTKPNRYAVYDDNRNFIRYEYHERADEPTEVGTPLSKANLLTDKIGVGTVNPTVCDAFKQSFAQIVVSTTSGSTVTCTNGTVTLIETADGSGKAIFYVGYGTWTVTATLSGQTATESVVVDQVKLYTTSLSYISDVFSENTWAKIISVCQSGKRTGDMGCGQPENHDHQQRELHRHHHRQGARHLRGRRHGSAHLPAAGLLRHHLQHEQLGHQQRRMDELRDAHIDHARAAGTDASRGAGRYQAGEQAEQRGQPELDHQHHGGQAVFCFQRWRYSAT